MESQHHAHLIIGEYPDVLALIDERDRTADTDTAHLLYEQLTIADARSLREQAHRRPAARPERVFLLQFQRATTEAQNALLKLLEDPPARTRFYVVVPREDACIPTLRSRLMRAGSIARPQGALAAEFLALSYGARLELVAEKVKAKDAAWIGRLLNGLEKWASERAGSAAGIRDIVLVRQYDRASGASQKMLLEHLALSLSDEAKVNTKS